MEDGPVFRDKWATWRSQSGARWPGLHEFEIGCTLEHVGYALSWLVALFGAVETLTAFSAVTFPDKGPGTEKIVITFSAGVAQVLPEEAAPEAVKRADQAMYLAKRAGRNRVLGA